MRALTAVHFTTDNALSVLDRDSAFALGEESDEEYDRYRQCETENGHDCDDDSIGISLGSGSSPLIDERNSYAVCKSGDTCDNVSKKYQRDTVSDTVFVDLLGEPHNECGTCAIACYNDECAEEGLTLVGKDRATLHNEVVANTCNECKSNGDVSGDIVELLLTLFGLRELAKLLGECNSKELDNDRCSDVRRDRKCEQGSS